jgi:subtilisin family serine protease
LWPPRFAHIVSCHRHWVLAVPTGRIGWSTWSRPGCPSIHAQLISGEITLTTRALIRCVVLAVTATLAVTAGTSAAQAAPAAPAAEEVSTYIVTLGAGSTDVRSVANAQLGEHSPGESPDLVFRTALRGYTAEMTASEAAALATEPGVVAVEPDAVVSIAATQANATWGIDRIDQRNRPLSTTYNYTNTGSGVDAYVIDTGIRFAHSDFGGRAVTGYDAVDGGSADDCNGHGTHVASTLGGTRYGVAKATRLIGVRVLNCSGSGSISGVIAGVDWATSNHVAGRPAVANMSLGGGVSTALDAAINRLHADGVTVVVAAGNNSGNACSGSPSRVPNAFTVAASDRNDRFASFSNRGSCVDIIAPGVSVTAAWSTSNTATNTISGTSMASPHAAGAAAKLLQSNPGATPTSIMNTLRSSATANVITGVPSGTPNRLLFSN